MNVEKNKKNKYPYLESGEMDENSDSGHQMVRAALLTLPQVSAPPGFEFRLQRCIRYAESGQPARDGEPILTWRWLSVGLGVATAVTAGLILYEPQTQTPSAMFSESAEQPAVHQSSPFPVTAPSTASLQAEHSYTGSPERITDGDMVATDGSAADSASRTFHPSEGQMQVVGGERKISGH